MLGRMGDDQRVPGDCRSTKVGAVMMAIWCVYILGWCCGVCTYQATPSHITFFLCCSQDAPFELYIKQKHTHTRNHSLRNMERTSTHGSTSSKGSQISIRERIGKPSKVRNLDQLKVIKG